MAQTLSGTGMVELNGYSPLRQKPVKVYYHIPAGETANMPILMVLHGDDRDANAYRQPWIAAANQYRFMVLAPEFSEAAYGGGNGYNLFNMFVNGDNPSLGTLNPDSVWTSAWLAYIFQYFKQRTGSVHEAYVAFGHSAGAQFLHRYMLYYPSATIGTAICANAGWYTLPSTGITFPYGTRLTRATDSTLAQAFRRKVVVMLGQVDNNPNSAGLRHNAEADAQGLHRLARGRYFYTYAQTEATRLRTSLAWQKVEVAGVGHNQALMATNAIPLVVEAFRQDFPNTIPDPLNCYYADGTLNVTGLLAGERVSIALTDLSGKVMNLYTGYPEGSLNIKTVLNPGLYLARLTTSFHAQQVIRFVQP